MSLSEPDNPLIYAQFTFADGARISVRLNPSVPQMRFMADLGELMGKWNQPGIDLVLPKPLERRLGKWPSEPE